MTNVIVGLSQQSLPGFYKFLYDGYINQIMMN